MDLPGKIFEYFVGANNYLLNKYISLGNPAMVGNKVEVL